jgi:hypothetical protein
MVMPVRFRGYNRPKIASLFSPTFVVLSSTGVPVNAVTGAPLVLSGAPSNVIQSAYGPLIQPAVGATWLTTSTGIITPQATGYTIIWVGSTLSGNYQELAYCLDNNPSDFNRQIRVASQLSSSDGQPAGAVCLLERYSGVRVAVETSTLISEGKVICVAFVVGPGLPANPILAYADGVNVTTNPAADSSFRAPAAPNAAIFNTFSNGSTAGTLAFAAINRPLSAQEIAAYFSSPSVALRTLIDLQNVIQPIGGIASTYTMSNATFVPGSITSTGVQAQVNVTVA